VAGIAHGKATELPGCDGTDEDVLTYAMFPAGGREVLCHPVSKGPKNLGKDPDAKPPVIPVALASSNGNGHVRVPVTYEVKLNGNTHKVTVSAVLRE
jgi:methylmalonyl-CoA carboxyltransferase 5S subunit